MLSVLLNDSNCVYQTLKELFCRTSTTYSRSDFSTVRCTVLYYLSHNSEFLSNNASSLVALQLSWEDIETKENGKPSRRYCFVGWAGESSTTGVSIEVSSNLAECLHLYSGQQVISFFLIFYHKVDVVPIHTVTKATTVCVEPVSSDDWEIVVLILFIQILILRNCMLNI